MEMMKIVCVEYIGEFSNTHFGPTFCLGSHLMYDVLYNVNNIISVIHL